MNELEQIYLDACNGNKDAMLFVAALNQWFNLGDDLIDQPDRPDPEQIGQFGMNALILTQFPFFITNSNYLFPVMMQAISNYLDSVKYERAEEGWKRNMADNIRYCGNDVVVSVAMLCGGIISARAISLRLREQSWKDHHDELGKAI